MIGMSIRMIANNTRYAGELVMFPFLRILYQGVPRSCTETAIQTVSGS